jgi:hypothetical protein
MYSRLSRAYTNLNWNYLDISNKAINHRYDWVYLSWANALNKKYPWTHEYDMVRLFTLCRTFSSKQEAQMWMTDNLKQELKPIHLYLMDIFCYSEIEIKEPIDSLIGKADEIELFNFILVVLDRALLWHNPEPCWPSYFKWLLIDASDKLKKGIKMPLTWVEEPKIEGIELVSCEDHIHVFYKFRNLINGVIEGALYYDIKYLAKQAHEVLLKSMNLYFDNRYSPLSEENWECKLKEIEMKETDWCKVQFLYCIANLTK